MTRALPVAALLAAAACGAGGRGTPPAAGTRFVLEVASGRTGPVYVLVESSDAQPGWVSVTGAGGRVHLRERCELAECGAAPGVCGSALPLVRNLGAGARSHRIEFSWDGRWSVVDSSQGCERRLPAPPGEYVARFCHATAAQLSDGDPSGEGAMGQLATPTCTDRRFRLGDTLVVQTID